MYVKNQIKRAYYFSIFYGVFLTLLLITFAFPMVFMIVFVGIKSVKVSSLILVIFTFSFMCAVYISIFHWVTHIVVDIKIYEDSIIIKTHKGVYGIAKTQNMIIDKTILREDIILKFKSTKGKNIKLYGARYKQVGLIRNENINYPFIEELKNYVNVVSANREL